MLEVTARCCSIKNASKEGACALDDELAGSNRKTLDLKGLPALRVGLGG